MCICVCVCLCVCVCVCLFVCVFLCECMEGGGGDGMMVSRSCIC